MLRTAGVTCIANVTLLNLPEVVDDISQVWRKTFIVADGEQ